MHRPTKSLSDEANYLAQRIHSQLQTKRDQVLSLLSEVGPHHTASLELCWTLHALSTVEQLISSIRGRVSLGTVATYMPFNVPLYSLYLYVIAPILAGNRVRVHLSSSTGWVAEQLIDLLLPDLMNRVEICRLSRDQFTAQVACSSDGAIIAAGWRTSQEFLRRAPERVAVIYQGAGINPFIVGPDTDLELAVGAAFRSRCFNSGQDCCCSERFYVHEQILDRFVGLLENRVQKAVVGPNRDPRTDIGPLVRPQAAGQWLNRLSGEDAVRVIVAAHLDGAYLHPGIYILPLESDVMVAEKFCTLFTLAPYENEDVLTAHLTANEHRMVISVFGASTLLQRLAGSYGHLLANSIIYDVEDAHVPFGGYGKSTFVRRPHQRELIQGRMYLPFECTRPASLPLPDDATR